MKAFLCAACIDIHHLAVATHYASKMPCERCGNDAGEWRRKVEVPYLKPTPKHQALNSGALAPGAKP